MIQLTNLYKTYNMGGEKINALDGVNLTILQGEFVAIIGPSGSGKSTLMNIIGCLDKPSAGQYLLGQRDVTHLDGDELADVRSRELGFVFQGFNLLPRLDALHNVELPLVYQGAGWDERKKRATAALERMGLGARVHHKPSQLSGGQQQRVAIARALVTYPSLILADEPTGNLDSRSGTEVLAVLKDLHRQGNTVLLITHDHHVAEAADRQVTIQDGCIVKDELSRASH
jgi:putative ABC transport system ATP-binding protein